MTRITGDNGEIVFEKEEDVLFTRFEDSKGYISLANERYLKMPLKMGLPPAMKNGDLRHLLKLGEFLTADNALYYRKRPMTANDMVELLDMDRAHVYAMIRRLTEVQLITKYEAVYYYNPMYFTVNRWISPTCYRAWETLMRQYLSDWVIDRFEKVAPQRTRIVVPRKKDAE